MLPTKVQEKKWKIDFQDGHNGCHLWFPIKTILAIFDLQVIQILSTKFHVSWPSGVGGVAFKANCWCRMTEDAQHTTHDEGGTTEDEF